MHIISYRLYCFIFLLQSVIFRVDTLHLCTIYFKRSIESYEAIGKKIEILLIVQI